MGFEPALLLERDFFSYKMEWRLVFMNMCKILKNRSKCIKYQTSAIVVKDTQIMGIGYNGTASKQQECCDYWLDIWKETKSPIAYGEWTKTKEFRDLHSKWSCINEIHAEVNALNWISKKDINDTYAIYTYYSPCEQCAKQILSYGIKNVYYCEQYNGRSTSGMDGLKFLQERGITCLQISV